jgi:hypothetical protein
MAIAAEMNSSIARSAGRNDLAQPANYVRETISQRGGLGIPYSFDLCSSK